MGAVGDAGDSRRDAALRIDDHGPGKPGADAEGYVRTPNVNTLLEVMDMRQAQRSYEANLNASEASKNMIMRTIDLLR